VIAVLDTNVLISGIFFGGIPRAILDAWADEAFDILLSPAILEEYQKTSDRLAETHPNLAYQRILLDLTRHGVFVPDSPQEPAITQDPDDDKFLQCAREGGAHSVVSGDKHLLAVTGWNDIQVLTPRAFLDRLIDRS
jgi:putative PIN family toxin of toxin-antitoxin system